MSAATDLMSKYAAYHRDRRNIATHFVGIPLIVFAVGGLLARPVFAIGPLEATPALALWALTTLWYLSRGHLALGALTSVANLMLILAAAPLGQAGHGRLARLEPRRLLRRLAHPVHRPLLRGPQAGLRGRPARPAGGPDVRGGRSAVRSGLGQGARRRDRVPRGADPPA